MTSLADILAEPEASKVPLFPVEPPDGHKHLSEIKRCVSFRKSMILLSAAHGLSSRDIPRPDAPAS